MDTFANLLTNLESDVEKLVGGLEYDIRAYLANKQPATSPLNKTNSGVTASNQYNPKWKGLRGIWRWLWKGHSKDNPDYAHLYSNENTKRRPTLKEYLEYQNKIEECANEILKESFEDIVLNESNDPFITNLLNTFKQQFKNLIKIYQSKIKDVSAPVPAQAPAQSASSQSSNTSGSTQPAVVAGSSPPQSDIVPNKRDRIKWVDEAVKRLESGDKLDAPEKSWLTNSQSKLKEEKLISTIIWLAHDSNAKHNLNSESAIKELKSRLGSQFKQDVFKTLKKWYPNNTEEVINKLMGSSTQSSSETKEVESKPEVKSSENKEVETKTKSTSSETKEVKSKSSLETKAVKPKEIKANPESKSSEIKTNQEDENFVKSNEEKLIEKIKKEIVGKNKEQLLKIIENKIIEPLWVGLTEDNKEEIAEKIRLWWIDFSGEENVQDEESLSSFITTGALLRSLQKETDKKLSVDDIVKYLT